MSWTILVALALALGLAFLAALARRAELSRMLARVKVRDRAVRAGAKAQLQHPVIDLSRCLGCGACVRACPEDGVLELVHGQAVVVNGSKCAGVAACARECPVGAITVTLTGLEERRDIPVLTEELEAVGFPGLFLAGEVTAHALIKTAIEHGTAVAAEVTGRVRTNGSSSANGVLDLCIVGAGPAGLACALESKRRGLSFVVLDQESGPGGTIAKYPRRKLVLMRPVELPIAGRLAAESYSKEDLMAMWHRIAEEQELPLRYGQVFQKVDRAEDGTLVVRTATESFRARTVCLALGRRGTPRKLDVPGEELSKVAYGLTDAASYRDRRILVVGGGDSAVEAAVGLAEQPGNEVTLSYRKEAFFRLKTKNEQRLEHARRDRGLHVLFQSQVTSIRPDEVDLQIGEGARLERATLPNDDVFVLAGGIAPLELLERSGVSFDPKLRPAVDPIVEQGPGLARALGFGFGLALLALLWAFLNRDYYGLPAIDRPVHAKNLWLRPGQGLGLALGIAACALVAANLLYLLRRERRAGFTFGSLESWMTMHVATGILALLCAAIHAGMDTRNTVGGHAFLGLVLLLVTGAVGRYFYAWVPRAANGRELDVAEAKRRVAALLDTLDASQRAFVERVESEIHALVERRQWKGSFLGRVLGLVLGARDLRRVLASLEREGRAQGVPADRLAETLALARRAHGAAVMAAHYEDLRALLNAWRYLHRWGAALVIALIVLHVAFALGYGGVGRGGIAP